MKAHRIRLAGPWEAQLLDDEMQPVGGVFNCRLPFVMLPNAMLSSQYATGVLLLRGFHRPTGIDKNSVLRIILKANQRPHEVRINSTPVEVSEASHVGTTNLDDSHHEFSIDITQTIDAFNKLSVNFQIKTPEMPATLESAWLEIQS